MEGGWLATVEDASWCAAIGACAGGVLGLVNGAAVELRIRQRLGREPGILSGGLLGILAGGLVGCVLAVVGSAWLGALPGAIGGSVLAALLQGVGRRAAAALGLCLLRIWLGAMVYCVVPCAWMALGGPLP